MIISRILIALFCAPALFAETGAIGLATADGSILLNRIRVWGNATLFDGSGVETTSAMSLLHLAGGTQIRLGASTRATVFERKLVLETGIGQLEAAGANYEIQARSLRISPGSVNALTRIKLGDGGRVIVAAIRGDARVANAAGVLVANLPSGTALTFDPQADGAVAPTRATGCLLQKNGQFVILDTTTNVLLELQAPDSAANLGNHVTIAGIAKSTAPSVPGASQVVRVAGMEVVSRGGCRSVAAKLGASTTMQSAGRTEPQTAAKSPTTPVATAGSATSTGTVAIIGGVAAAAAVGGLAAVGALPGQQESSPTASR